MTEVIVKLVINPKFTDMMLQNQQSYSVKAKIMEEIDSLDLEADTIYDVRQISMTDFIESRAVREKGAAAVGCAVLRSVP